MIIETYKAVPGGVATLVKTETVPDVPVEKTDLEKRVEALEATVKQPPKIGGIL